MQASEARIAQLSYYACQHCGQEVEKDFVICPNCHSRLRDPCPNCRRPLEMTWSVCPYCEASVLAGLHPPRRRREALASEAPPGT
jgi:RNA polymerase subunit RPABC4/transcription elongation factor Spt4